MLIAPSCSQRRESSAAQDENGVYKEDGEKGCQLKQPCQVGIDKDCLSLIHKC